MKISNIFSSLFIFSIVIILSTCKKSDDIQDNPADLSCKITSPVNGGSVIENNMVEVLVSATSKKDNLTGVTFYINGIEKFVDKESPYTYQWYAYSHNYTIGKHIIKAVAKDSDGNTASDSISYSITELLTENPPSANFTVDSMVVTLGNVVHFKDESTSGPSTWQWDFGDGQTSTIRNPEHTYKKAGAYMVTLTVSNKYGSDTEEQSYPIRVYDRKLYHSGPCSGSPTIKDIDGNIYKTIQIGNQCWMAENLKTGVRINNNSPIDKQTNNNIAEKFGYDNTDSNCNEYGGLYQWDEMMQYIKGDQGTIGEVQGICPEGWHIPTDKEWQTLEIYLGLDQTEATLTGGRGFDIGGKMKETGNAHWENGTNDYFLTLNTSGFTALPGGQRTNGNNLFSNIKTAGFFWSASDDPANDQAYTRALFDNDGRVYRNFVGKEYGLSVRCMKD